VITIILLHPNQNIPLQSWTFDQEETISIGRSTENDIVVYSAVVSRHHLKLQKKDTQWECINMGANGTFIDGNKITQLVLEDGMTIRLADTGPKIQVKIGVGDPEGVQKTKNKKAPSPHDKIHTFIRDV
jgi:pSer/pThr/pTyr-binding forkhead associated (FHA) protein